MPERFDAKTWECRGRFENFSSSSDILSVQPNISHLELYFEMTSFIYFPDFFCENIY